MLKRQKMKPIIQGIRFAIFTTCMALALSGCNKMLNLNPIGQLSSAGYWSSANDFQLAANEFYTYEMTYSKLFFDGGSYNNPHSDYRSDLTATRGNVFSNGSNAVPNTDGNYSTDYSNIRTINTLLTESYSYSAPSTIAEYVAEAHFFRAYEYFDLLQMYGGVPLITLPLQPSSDSSSQLFAPQASRDAVVNFIIADLDSAIANLPLASALPSTSLGRITKGAAQAFLGRVTLYEGTWQEFRGNTSLANTYLTMAVASSDSVIASAQYQLFQPAALGDSAQKYMFILENEQSNPANLGKSANNEYILANRYDQATRVPSVNITKTMLANVFPLSRTMANMYLCSDGLPTTTSPLFQGYSTMTSEYENRDNRMRYNMMISGQPYWSNAKYHIEWNWSATDLANADFTSFNPTNTTSGYNNQKWCSERDVPDYQESYDYPVIRYAEVLLNYAEAVFELNGQITDAQLNISLNLVRQRVNPTMPALSNELLAADNLDMRTEIRRERTVELYTEGFRTDDLKRWKTAETQLPMDLLGIQWQGTQFQTTWPALSSQPLDPNGCLILESGRTWAQKNYLLPFPTQQLELNPRLVQNTGW